MCNKSPMLDKKIPRYTGNLFYFLSNTLIIWFSNEDTWWMLASMWIERLLEIASQRDRANPWYGPKCRLHILTLLSLKAWLSAQGELSCKKVTNPWSSLCWKYEIWWSWGRLVSNLWAPLLNSTWFRLRAWALKTKTRTVVKSVIFSSTDITREDYSQVSQRATNEVTGQRELDEYM